MKGVFFSNTNSPKYESRDFDIPTPGEDEVLIKNVAVASNPKDWKVIQWVKGWEAIEGNDVCGHVEAVGSKVTEFKKGDKVAAFSVMMKDTKYGAYAEYTVAPAHTTWHVAESTPYEDAATLPLAVMTAQIGLFKRLALPTPPEDGSDAPSNGQVVVVNGAASSVGAFAVQLAKKAGYVVVGTAGSSAKVAQELGAVVVDYRGKSDDELAQAIKEEVGKVGKLAGTYDAVSTDSTVDFLAKIVEGSGGGLITTVLPTRGEEKPDSIPSSVKVVRTMVGTAHSDDSEFAKKWYRIIGGWLDQGKFKANDVKVLSGGLDGVAEGMDLLEQGKVNGVKLVYRISETKSLQ